MSSIETDAAENESVTVVRLTKDSRNSKIATWLPIVLSICALILSLFPQINPLNRNYRARAEAGDTKAQMFLAEHYYSVGDIEESDYWYKIAAMTYGAHRAAALNNVAYIGMTYGYYDEKIFDYQSKALDMFREAAYLGNSVAVQNMYTFLKECQSTNVPEIDYQSEITWVIRVAEYYGIFLARLDAQERNAALAAFHLDRDSGIVSADGYAVYPGVGIFPEEDAFSKFDKQYSSYLYSHEGEKNN